MQVQRLRAPAFDALPSCAPACWSDQLEWVEAKGTGSVHSFTIIRRAPMAAFAPRAPYVLALIDLDEGPRI